MHWWQALISGFAGASFAAWIAWIFVHRFLVAKVVETCQTMRLVARLNGPHGPEFFNVDLATIERNARLGIPLVIEAMMRDRLYLQVRLPDNG